ncbi:hypothetical protein AAZV13_19G060600 [Glycine max]
MSVVAQLVRRAERAGFKAIALTVDTLRLGRREADIKNRFTLPPFLTLKNFEGLDLGKMDKADDFGLASNVVGQIDRTLSWKDVKWLQTITKLPILVKGVLTTVDSKKNQSCFQFHLFSPSLNILLMASFQHGSKDSCTKWCS